MCTNPLQELKGKQSRYFLHNDPNLKAQFLPDQPFQPNIYIYIYKH